MGGYRMTSRVAKTPKSEGIPVPGRATLAYRVPGQRMLAKMSARSRRKTR